MVFISNRKNYMFLPIAAIFRFDDFLTKRVLYNIPKPCGDVEISSSFYMLLLSQIGGMSIGSINCRKLGVDLSGWVGAGLDCSCCILYALCWGWWFIQDWLVWHLILPLILLILQNFLFSTGVGLPPGFCYLCVCIGLAHLVFFYDTHCSENWYSS